MNAQNSSKDLEGLLVVTVEQAVAAPYTSCRLADAGARVIKVERPEEILPGIMIVTHLAIAPILFG